MNKIFIGGSSSTSENFVFYQINKLYEFFKQNNYELVKGASDADVIFVTGAPFINIEKIKTFLTINYYLKKYPAKKIIAFGYISDMIYDLESFGNFKIIKSYNLSEINKLFSHSIKIEDIKVSTIRYFAPLKIEDLNLTSFGYETNIESSYVFNEKDLSINFLKLKKGEHDISGIEEYDSKYSYLEDKSEILRVQTCLGCIAKCSHCIITKIGWAKSIALEEILNTIKKGLLDGKKIIYLLDQDTLSYGKDIGLDYVTLFNSINKIEGDFKIDIRHIERGNLVEFYNKVDKSIWKRIIRLGLPLHTTSQRILKLMHRNYDIQANIDLVIKLRKEYNIFIFTQFIYGVPTETFEEFKDYFRMLKYFDYIDMTLYSESKDIGLSKIKKNSIDEIYKKYMFYQKMCNLFPDKIENTDLKNISPSLIVKYLY